MSATVSPAQGMRLNVRSDPSIRLRDYLDAFRFYVALPDHLVDRVILLENSDADLSVFRQIAAKQGGAKVIECINTDSKYDGSKGKGYGEFRMLDEGLRASSLKDPTAVLWKVTGRLIVPNLPQLIERAPTGYDIYCDLRDIPFIGEALGGNKWMDCRLFSFSLRGYDDYLRGTYDLGSPIEKYLFKVVSEEFRHGRKRQGERRFVPRLNVQPIFHGFSGYANRNYQSTADRAKNILRSIARFVAPPLWL